MYLMLFLIFGIFSVAGCGKWFSTSKPTITRAIPANVATGVYTNIKMAAIFSEEMDPTSINDTTFIVIQGDTVVPGSIAYTGVTAVFTPASFLTANTVYTVTIKSEVKNLEGNAMANDYIWTFTTGATSDLIPPTITLADPADLSISVATNIKVAATFSEDMDPLSVTASTFTLSKGTTPVLGTVALAGMTAIFTPTTYLEANTLYTATITTGANDMAGNALVTNYVWAFTTGDSPDLIRPTVTLVAPLTNAQNVPSNSSINATFSEHMFPLTITNLNFLVVGSTAVTGVVTYDPITNIATFNPDDDLDASTTYTATISTGVKDLAGNTLAVNYVWHFTTGTGVMPIAVQLGLIAPYGMFGGIAGMTNTGNLTVINGDTGSMTTHNSDITGFHEGSGTLLTDDTYTDTLGTDSGSVTGQIYTCTNSTKGPNVAAVAPNPECTIAINSHLAGIAAFNTLALMPSDGVLAANLAGTTIYPGVYTNSSSVMVQGGDVTLDALGDANAVFVFQIGSTLTVGGPGIAFPQSIILINGAKAKNIFWQVGTSATINAAGGGTMEGTIIAQTALTFSTVAMGTPLVLNGRALSLTAGVSMNNTVVNLPTP